jgi:hypothetical protein
MYVYTMNAPLPHSIYSFVCTQAIHLSVQHLEWELKVYIKEIPKVKEGSKWESLCSQVIHLLVRHLEWELKVKIKGRPKVKVGSK